MGLPCWGEVRSDLSGGGWRFDAAQAPIPDAVRTRVEADLVDFDGSGGSILQLSFSDPRFRALHDEARTTLARLLALPPEYEVLFLSGGASAQFSLVPLNLLGVAERTAYVEAGHWSRRAIGEAGRYSDVDIVASGPNSVQDRVPTVAANHVDAECAYLHVTANETAEGIEFDHLPEDIPIPTVADMTSNFLTRPVDWSRCALAYASAQKNLGVSGLTLIVLHPELLGRARPETPSAFNYAVQCAAGGRYNTPPVFAVYLAGLMFRWVESRGGLSAMDAAAREKSGAIYSAIDASGGFYRCRAAPGSRSRVNVCFDLPSETGTEAFVAAAARAGFLALDGHPSRGGVRVSLYNAVPLVAAQTLAAFMREYVGRHG